MRLKPATDPPAVLFVLAGRECRYNRCGKTNISVSPAAKRTGLIKSREELKKTVGLGNCRARRKSGRVRTKTVNILSYEINTLEKAAKRRESETARCIRKGRGTKFATPVWEKREERGVIASASERRLASHLLRRQSMTLPSTVEEQATIYAAHTHARRANFEKPRGCPGVCL